MLSGCDHNAISMRSRCGLDAVWMQSGCGLNHWSLFQITVEWFTTLKHISGRLDGMVISVTTSAKSTYRC